MLKITKKIPVKVLLKRENKRSLYTFCSLSRSSLSLIQASRYNLTRSYKKESSNFSNYVIKWDIDNSSRISSIFWQYLSCNFEKKLFLWGAIVSVNRRTKKIKVTRVSFGLNINMKTRYFIFWWGRYMRQTLGDQALLSMSSPEKVHPELS